jgi:hypothetical protein
MILDGAGLASRLRQLRAEAGLADAVPDPEAVGDWSARIESLRAAQRVRESSRVAAEAALPGVEIARGVRCVRWSQAGLPAPPVRLPWEPAAADGPLLLLDTETTGLAGGSGTLVFLLALARWEGERLELEQWLLTAPSAEAAWIDAWHAGLPVAHTLVSYNGRAFDIPLLAARQRLSRRPDRFLDRPHWDLLAPVRRAFGSRWDDCRLATAERKLLGLERVDDLPGAFAPAAWLAFLRHGETARLREAIAHNRQDVLSLARLLPALLRVHAEPEAYDADGTALARRLLQCGEREAALAVLERTPGESAALARARELRRDGRPREALEALEGVDGAERSVPILEALAKLHEHILREPQIALARAVALSRLEPEATRHHRRIDRLRRRIDRCSAQSPGLKSQCEHMDPIAAV